MPKRRQPIDKSRVAKDILCVLETYAKDEQFYPTQRGLHNQMINLGYPHTRGSFDYWFDRLVQAGYIAVDYEHTRAIRATSLVIIERDDLESANDSPLQFSGI